MSSDGPNHNELDLEFLGNVSRQPCLQTNIYINGIGNHEQHHALWFDPTTTFHAYSLLWNCHHICFFIDNIPIRIFSHFNTSLSPLIPYPNNQPMGVYAFVWNADDWATQGERVKTNWSNASFVPEFQGFEIDSCVDVEGKCGVEGEFRAQKKYGGN